MVTIVKVCPILQTIDNVDLTGSTPSSGIFDPWTMKNQPVSWRFQFSLRTLIILTALAGVLIWLNFLPPHITWASSSDLFFRWSGWPFSAYDGLDSEPTHELDNHEKCLERHVAKQPCKGFRSPGDIALNTAACFMLLLACGIIIELFATRGFRRMHSRTKLILWVVAAVLIALNLVPGNGVIDKSFNHNYVLRSDIADWDRSLVFGWPFVICTGEFDVGIFRAGGLDEVLKNVAFAIVVLTSIGVTSELIICRIDSAGTQRG